MSAKCPPWNFTMHHGSICCCRTRFWAFYFCDTGRLYCLLLWFWHTVIFYFCDTDIHLLSTFVALAYIYCHFSDTSTNFCYTIVTLVVVHIYFLFLWHCYTLILFFCDTGKTKKSSFCHRHIFCFCDTSTYLLSTSVTLIWYTLLSTWHWYTFIFCFCDTCTHLFSSSKDWTAADPTIVKTKELVGLINLLVNSLKSHEDC